jgi:DNA-binding winged helix-turn-helix (wHTH) protein/TolB-like protein/Flp pilus assembly protein TadD
MLEQKQQIYRFDNFRLDVRNRELLCDGRPVTLPAKAFDMLVVLIENGGRLIEKDELFNRVWPNQIVEESNLTVQVSAIRKALGERKENPHYIATVPGHGYRFIGQVLSLDEEEEEVTIERHLLSRVTVETERAQAQIGEDSPNGGSFIDISPGAVVRKHETGNLRRPRFVARRYLLLAGVAVIVISLTLVFALKRLRSRAELASGHPIRSIAVLPFKPIDASNRDESLELGMADTLITRLSGLKEVVVRPTSAVRKYASLEQDVIAAGKEQRVDAVLDGSLQRSGDRLRVTVRFVRVADGQVLWVERFDDNFTDIFAVQDRVSEKVNGLLAVKLTDQERMLLTKRDTDKTAAYELYLKGGQEQHLEKSLEFFQRAITLDPKYASAYAEIARIYIFLGGTSGFRPPRETLPKAKEALTKALEIDETLAEGHALLATYKLNYEWNWRDAEREFKRALELNPNNSLTRHSYSIYFQTLGRFDEALAERKLAEKFDPLNPNSIANVGWPLFFARRYDEAIEHFRRAIELEPNYVWGHIWIAEAYAEKGMYEEAINEVNKALSLSPGNTRALAVLGYVHALAGRRDEARKVLGQFEEMAKQKYVPPFFFAMIHIGLGEKDQAFEWLEKAYQERHAHLINLKIQPVYDPLRADPRFDNLVRRVGL